MSLMIVCCRRRRVRQGQVDGRFDTIRLAQTLRHEELSKLW
jgi:hypothetical protein